MLTNLLRAFKAKVPELLLEPKNDLNNVNQVQVLVTMMSKIQLKRQRRKVQDILSGVRRDSLTQK